MGPKLGLELEVLVNGNGSEVELPDTLLRGAVGVSVLEFEIDELSGPALMLMEINGLGEVDDVVPPDVGFAVSEAKLPDGVDTADVLLSEDVALEI